MALLRPGQARDGQMHTLLSLLALQCVPARQACETWRVREHARSHRPGLARIARRIAYRLLLSAVCAWNACSAGATGCLCVYLEHLEHWHCMPIATERQRGRGRMGSGESRARTACSLRFGAWQRARNWAPAVLAHERLSSLAMRFHGAADTLSTVPTSPRHST
ncbi:hypothetical protein T440DRAFT_89130 [Plenodomus tracheiphilus IPT5]|uniref:Uncharacterized protein n=1 Tax=Plenodomus tracheiphilus IPT5 TaxID=1408161 RepID=A0A6A7B7V9_9PLEO|nr:hypothetical protein T440DRAFT_89130 [Plenodomus tracheiphilus IPT5]